MPKVLEANGFAVYIYLNDHTPAHVHVFRGRFGGEEIVINLRDLSVRENYMKANEARRALELVEKNRDFLQSEWDRINDK